MTAEEKLKEVPQPYKVCPACAGSGQSYYKGIKCPRCGGKGGIPNS